MFTSAIFYILYFGLYSSSIWCKVGVGMNITVNLIGQETDCNTIKGHITNGNPHQASHTHNSSTADLPHNKGCYLPHVLLTILRSQYTTLIGHFILVFAIYI